MNQKTSQKTSKKAQIKQLKKQIKQYRAEVPQMCRHVAIIKAKNEHIAALETMIAELAEAATIIAGHMDRKINHELGE